MTVLDFSSVLWRLITGILAGWIITSLVLLFSRTRSNVSYLLSYGSVFRLLFWLTIIALISDFRFNPLNIIISDDVYFILALLFLLDSFLMGFTGLIFGKRSYLPLTKQYPAAEQKFREGFKVYNDVPVVSIVYPFFRWLFG